VDKIIDKIKNTPDWKSRDGHDVSDKVETSHFLTPDGELIGNYNHQTMVSELAPMIDGFELTGKTGGGSIKEKDGTWTKLPYRLRANWNDITNFLAHTGFVRATNEGIGERGFGHSINLTVNGILTNSQIRAIQRMEQTSPAGTTLVFDIMGDETHSGHGTFRDFMRAYRKNYGIEVFREEDRERIPAGQPNAGQWVASGGQFAKKEGGDVSSYKKDGGDSGKLDYVEDGKSIVKRLNKHGYPLVGLANLFEEVGIKVERNDYLYIGQPLRTNAELEKFNENVELFYEQVKKEPKLAEAYESFKKEIKEYNNKLEKKYQEAETFKRGTSMAELESYIKDDCISCDWRDDNTLKLGRNYEFLSLSMNESEVESLYNFGVIIDFEGESVRNVGRRVNYSDKPVPYPAQSSSLGSKVKKLESHDTEYDAYFADEQEVRIPKNTKLSDVKINKIRITGHKIMGYNHLSMFDKQLAKDFVDSMRDGIKSKEFYEKNEDRIIKAINNKYGKLTDNIEVNYV
jgi:hypothetical protein